MEKVFHQEHFDRVDSWIGSKFQCLSHNLRHREMSKHTKFLAWMWPAVIGGVALVIRTVALHAYQASVLFQPLEGGAHDRSLYLDAIRRVAGGEWRPTGAFEYLPLYPWIAGLVSNIFSIGPMTTAWFGIGCDVVTTALIVRFATKLGTRPAVASIAGLFYAAYPLAVIYSLQPMPNTLNALGVTLFVFLAHELLEKREESVTRISFFLLGLLAGLISLGFAGMLMMAAAVMVLTIIKTRSRARVLLFAAGMILPITPVALHNSRAENQFVLLTTHGGFNYYMGNNERATGFPLRLFNFRMTAKAMLEDAHRHAEQSTGHDLSRTESSAWWKTQARVFWREHPGQAALLTLKKAALFWNKLEVDDLRLLEQLQITDRFFRHFKGTPFAVIGIMGLTGLIFARGAAVPRWTFFAGMVGLILFFITARYRLTFVPMMLVLGAAGICRISVDWKLQRKQFMLFIIPALVLVCWPVRVRDQGAIDHYNVATQLSAAGRTEEAMTLIQRGLEIDPAFDQLYAAKGGVYFDREHYAEAAEAFSMATLINPSNPLHSYNLALSLARAGDYCGARDALLEAQRMGARLDERTLRLLQELSRACDG